MEDKTFEEALVSLEEIIRDLEKGEVELDKMVVKYSEAMNLVKFCSKKLNDASETVNKILNEKDELIDFKINE